MRDVRSSLRRNCSCFLSLFKLYSTVLILKFFPDRLPSDIDQITDFLYLGSQETSRNYELLKKRLKITCLIDATNNPKYYNRPAEEKSTFDDYLAIKIEDRQRVDIAKYFDTVSDKIDQCSKNGATFLFCRAGISRSATFCLAYLMKYKKLSLRQAYDVVRQKRFIMPNSGFWRQLINYEYQIFGQNSLTPKDILKL
uniref:Protein-tyrosine-phosphatase n=1 Tax=Romanomermis culicivorax TaxID=13658 RepID=A0A915I270_ROMCU